jgi:hypothetical protein
VSSAWLAKPARATPNAIAAARNVFFMLVGVCRAAYQPEDA